MSKNDPPAYGFVPPPSAPPSYAQAVNGVQPAAPLTPQQPILTAQHIVTTVIPLGSSSTHTICPSCRAEINTRTKKSPSIVAYVSGLLIAIFCCWQGCCLIPCCIDECMETTHYCPNCNCYLGRRSP